MNKDEEFKLLLEVYREQPLPNKTLKELKDIVEVRSVNFSVEQKLDKIIELLEKLTNKITVINTPITVKSEDKNVGADIASVISKLTNKVKEPGKEKSIARANKIDWNSLKVEKPTIRLLDDKGNVINFECQIKDDGSITCLNKDAVIVEGSLKKDDKNKEFNDGRPKVLVEDDKKRKSSIFTPDGKQFWVFKKKKEKFVKVGTAEIVGEPPIVRITFLTDYKKEYIENPSSYEYGFWTMTDYGGSSWLGYQKNLLESYQFKYNFTELTSPEGVTGYLTNEGRAVYYDQYL